MPQYQTKNLWKQLDDKKHLQSAISEIRSICEILGNQISRLIPGFTDHSVKYMDALWSVCDEIFKPEEVQKFSSGEAFILGASFYLHDIGMALASTKEGIEELKSTDLYKGYYSRSILVKNLEHNQAEIFALQLTARDLHAPNSL